MARVGLDEVHDAEGFVDADEGFFVGGRCAFDEGEVGFAGKFVDVNVLLELAPRGLYGCVAHVFEQAFGTAAVFDEVGNGADFEIVFFSELHQFGHTRHGAVVVDDFADDGGGNQAIHLCQVNAGFCVSGADEYAAFLGAQWEDVAGLDDVFWFGGWGNGGLNGQGAIGGGDAGGNAVGGFDGDGKVGAILRAVFLGHHGQAEFFDHFAVHRQADQAACVFDHEVDGFRGDELGGHQQVAFVFAVFGIGDDDHFAGFDVC